MPQNPITDKLVIVGHGPGEEVVGHSSEKILGHGPGEEIVGHSPINAANLHPQKLSSVGMTLQDTAEGKMTSDAIYRTIADISVSGPAPILQQEDPGSSLNTGWKQRLLGATHKILKGFHQ